MRKPKIIPKGFIWDPKAKELVDVRANNPKLRKLMRESIRVDIPDEVKYVSQETGVNFNDILRLYEHGWKVVKTEDDIRKTMKRLLDED